jgi:hypothetical protein
MMGENGSVIKGLDYLRGKRSGGSSSQRSQVSYSLASKVTSLDLLLLLAARAGTRKKS